MTWKIAQIFIVAVTGSFLIPLLMLILARFGYFEPIDIDFFGRKFSFAPKPKRVITYGNVSSVLFPARQAAFASVVTITISVGASVTTQASIPLSGMTTRSAAGSIIRDLV